jgi:hypothetical protein
MCVRGRQSRCSTVIAETANSPVALLSLPVSSSWYPTQRSPVRRRRTQFVLAAVVSRLAAFAAIVALLYSRVAKLLQELCPSAFPRWTIIRSFSRCWTSGHPVRNRGFVLVRQFLTILSRLNSRMDVCHPTDKVRSRGFGVLRAQLRRPVAGGQSVPFGYFSYSMWFARHKVAVPARSTAPLLLTALRAELRRLDSIADSVFFVAALLAAWRHPWSRGSGRFPDR